MNVLDNFVIALGFDTKGLQKGQKETAAEMQKMRDSTRKTGKEIEDVAYRTGEGIGKMTRGVVTLFATIAGSTALTTLVTGLTTANAELGRFGANVGLAPQRLAAWGAAVQRVGGDASQAQGSIGKLAGTLNQFKMGLGNLPDGLFQLMGRSGVQIDTTGSTEKYINGVAAAIQKLSAQGDKGRQEAFNLAQSMGIDNATFEVMRKYGAGLEDYLKTLEKVGPSNKAIDSAQKMQESWAKLVQTLTEVTQKLYEVAAPAITKLIEALANMVERLTKDVDWNAIGEGMNTFAKYAAIATDNVNGLALATGALFTLWTGAKFASALANMLLFRGGGAAANAGNAAAAGAAGGGLLALLGRIATPAALAYLLMDDHSNGPNDAQMKKIRESEKDAWWNRKSKSDPQPDYNSLTRDPGAHGEKLAGDVKVDGRNVSKGNPLPVEIASGGGGKSGGSWWSNLWEAITGPSTASAATMPGGAGGGGGGSSGDSGGGGPRASVPSIAGMTPDERNFLGLVLQHESAGRNTMNYVGRNQGIDPTQAKGYTAQGYYQMLNSNWNRLAPKLGIKTKNAMASSLEDQTKVALALLRESGKGNWVNWNPKLRAAVARGDSAGKWGETVPDGSGYVDPMMVNVSGAKAAALTTSNDNRRSSIMNNSNDTRIGSITVNATGNIDGQSLADQMWASVMRRAGQLTTTAAANTGPM